MLGAARVYRPAPLRHGSPEAKRLGPRYDRGHGQQLYPPRDTATVWSVSSAHSSSTSISYSDCGAPLAAPSNSGSAPATSSSSTSSPAAVDLELLPLDMRPDSNDESSDSDGGFIVGSGATPYELDREMMGMLASNWNLNEQQQQQHFQVRGAPVWDSPALFGADSSGMVTSQAPAAVAAMGLHPVVSDMAMMNMMGMGFLAAEGNPLGPDMQFAAAPQPDPFAPFRDYGAVPPNDLLLSIPDDSAFPAPPPPQFQPELMDGTANPSAFVPMVSPPLVDNQLVDSSLVYSNSIKMDPSKVAVMNNVAPFVPVTNPKGSEPAFVVPIKLDAFAASSSASTGSSSSGNSTAESSPGYATSDSRCLLSPQSSSGKSKPKRIRRLCSIAGCGKRARSQDLCIAHGGGRRCIVEGCEKSSQGGNLCIKHGGGKRCRFPGCDKAAQTNSLCKAHGGGPRCQFNGCNKSSQGGGFCRAHGGGKRCAAEGCNKGTQRGDFCALHGGSRYCEVEGCTRNDRGGGFCAHHGGGKRCSVSGCNRSCRRNGMCSTHLRLTGREEGGVGELELELELEANF